MTELITRRRCAKRRLYATHIVHPQTEQRLLLESLARTRWSALWPPCRRLLSESNMSLVDVSRRRPSVRHDKPYKLYHPVESTMTRCVNGRVGLVAGMGTHQTSECNTRAKVCPLEIGFRMWFVPEHIITDSALSITRASSQRPT